MTGYNPDLFDTAPGVLVPTVEQRHGRALAYPPQGYDLTNPPEAFQVPAGDVTIVQIALGMSALHLQQPVAVKDIKDVTLVPDFSCYVVAGNDGLPIDPKEWRYYGGRILVNINPDTVTATLRIYPAELPFLAPFTIGFDDGSNTFGGLFLLGEGIALWKRGITLETGLGDDDVSEDSTPNLDNPFIQTEEQAWDAAHAALGRQLGDLQTVTLTVSGVRGLTDVDDLAPETALGRVAGARVAWDGLYYRVRRAQHTPAGIILTCEQDVTFGDVDTVLPAGITFAQMTALHSDAAAFRDFNADALRGGDLG